MVILTPRHLLTHNTRVDLSRRRRLPVNPSANSSLRGRGVQKHSLSMLQRTIIARVTARRVHKHGFIASLQSTDRRRTWEIGNVLERRGRDWVVRIKTSFPISSGTHVRGHDPNGELGLGLSLNGNRSTVAV